MNALMVFTFIFWRYKPPSFEM